MSPENVSDVLIVGSGQAGGRVALQLAALGYPHKVIVIGDEKYAPYERPPLSKAFLKNKVKDDELYLCPSSDWAKSGVEMLLGDGVVAIDPIEREVTLSTGRSLRFGSLVLATGGVARALAIPGRDLCINLRTLDDGCRLRDALEGAVSVAIVGAGVIGLEVASTAVALGKSVTVFEGGSRAMARLLPPAISDWLEGMHRAVGVDLRFDVQVDRVRRAPGGLVVEGPGWSVAADVVVSAVGMRPNAGLVPEAAKGPGGGILTDGFGRVPGMSGVYACGDVAESWNPIYGRPVRLETWRNADKQARAIAQTIAGRETSTAETPWMWTDQCGRNIQVVGLWREGATVVARGEVGAPGSSLYFLAEGVVAGGVLIDNGRDRRFLEMMVETGATPDLGALADPLVPLKSLA